VADTGVGSRWNTSGGFSSLSTRSSRRRAARAALGRGLAIAHQLAIQMGGELTVRSTPGAGSTFTLVLPVKPAAVGRGAEPGGGAGRPRALEGGFCSRRIPPNIRLLVEEIYLTGPGAR